MSGSIPVAYNSFFLAEQDSTSSAEKNPVQEWFENLSKNASTVSQNTFNSMKEFFDKFNNNQGGENNKPVMYMGGFQVLKMPIPSMEEVMKGMGNMALGFNSIFGGLQKKP